MSNRSRWPEERLGKYAYIKGRIGWRGLKASEYLQDGPYLIAGNHLADGKVDWSFCDHVSMYRYLESPEIALQKGDVILTKDGTIGRVALIKELPGLATINSTMMLVRVRSPLVAGFVYHYLTGTEFQKLVADKVSGSSIPHIFQRDMVELKIPVPHDAEQLGIAEILDTVDKAIQQTEALIAKLKMMKAGLLHDLLTRGLDEHGELRDPVAHPEQFKDSPLGRIPKEWDVCPIESKLHRIIDYRGRTPEKRDSGIPLITAKNVREGYVDPEPAEYIAEEDYDRWMVRGFPGNADILFTTEAPLGNVARVPRYKIALAQRLLTLCPEPNELDSHYLLYLLLWPESRRRFEQRSTGSTVLGIKQSVFRKVLLRFPRFEEQHLIGAKLSASDAHIRSEQTYCEKLKLLKKGLMQDLLTGMVRVKVNREVAS
jgi:type I restriction enzyme, S subunit